MRKSAMQFLAEMMPGRLTVALVAFVALSGCSSIMSSRYDRVSDETDVNWKDRVEVRRGDTLSEIATRHRVPWRQLASVNGIAPPYTIFTGQTLRVPANDATGEPPPSSRNDSGDDDTPYSSDGDLRPRVQTIAFIPVPRPKPRTGSSTASLAEPDLYEPVSAPGPTPTGAVRDFAWPLRGDVISTFGARGNGQFNDGINIAAPTGTPVKAAGDGVVRYAGNELRGFGKLLLIEHANGYITAYAHNSELLARRGDSVRRGQTIAKVGATGNVSEPQLHFEIRKGTRPVDPRTMLGAAR